MRSVKSVFMAYSRIAEFISVKVGLSSSACDNYSTVLPTSDTLALRASPVVSSVFDAYLSKRLLWLSVWLSYL